MISQEMIAYRSFLVSQTLKSKMWHVDLVTGSGIFLSPSIKCCLLSTLTSNCTGRCKGTPKGRGVNYVMLSIRLFIGRGRS